MKILDIESKDKFDIELKHNSGEERLLCIKCHDQRKNKKDKSLAWSHSKETGFCHHCSTTFVKFKEFSGKSYIKPKFINKNAISENVVKWFESRNISQQTLLDWKITEGIEYMPQVEAKTNTIQFNYFRNSELINVKYRDSKKNFKLYKDAELLPYGLDNLKDENYIIICEGEIDALTFYEAGYKNVISVPNGAKITNNNLTYFDNCIDIFDNYQKIIIATDTDIPGIALRNDIASRLGIEKCFKVSFKECKDVNEYVSIYGISMVKYVIDSIEPFPIEGVFTLENVESELDNMFKFGLKRGLMINDIDIDEFISFESGRLYTITGIPGHGKSEFLDYLITKINILHGLKCGIFSPENHPLQLHISKLISKISGKQFDENHLQVSEYEQCKEYVKDNFFFINPNDDFTFETILTKARQLVYQKGIKILIIDPYNKIEHSIPNGMSETNYISLFLDKITNFAKRNNIIIFLVAHPRKMTKVGKLHEVPSLYDINGSANFYNKTDFGITVYRNFSTGLVEVYFQKIKFKHLGELGMCFKKYNYWNGRYENSESVVDNWAKTSYLTQTYIEPVVDYKKPEITPNTTFDEPF